MKSFDYELTDAVEYTPKGSGELKEAGFITLNAPRVRDIELTSVVQDVFFEAMSALPSNTEGADQGGNDSVSGDDILDMIHMAKGVDSGRVYIAAKELFKSTGLIDGEKKVTAPLLDDLSLDDMRGMVAAYLENFILKSSLEKLKQMK